MMGLFGREVLPKHRHLGDDILSGHADLPAACPLRQHVIGDELINDAAQHDVALVGRDLATAIGFGPPQRHLDFPALNIFAVTLAITVGRTAGYRRGGRFVGRTCHLPER